MNRLSLKAFSVSLAVATLGTITTPNNFVLAQSNLNLTQPNGSCNNGLSLTQSNHCSTKLKIYNATPETIYYDFGSKEDRSIGSKRSTTWTLKGDSMKRIIAIDYDLMRPGIQLKRYNVYAGYSYKFVRSSDNRTIELVRVGGV